LATNRWCQRRRFTGVTVSKRHLLIRRKLSSSARGASLGGKERRRASAKTVAEPLKRAYRPPAKRCRVHRTCSALVPTRGSDDGAPRQLFWICALRPSATRTLLRGMNDRVGMRFVQKPAHGLAKERVRTRPPPTSDHARPAAPEGGVRMFMACRSCGRLSRIGMRFFLPPAGPDRITGMPGSAAINGRTR